MSTQPNAQMVLHSINPKGSELCTFTIELHRFILPEFNTHRTFSRNFQSSRAVPIQKLIDQVRNDPAMPVHWGKNQPGMKADQEHNALVWETPKGIVPYQSLVREEAWLHAANQAADMAMHFSNAGYHKQIVNRLLEPFMWTKGVVTCTKEALDAFFKLRIHPDAQPEIKALAEAMKEAYDNSTPQKLEWYGWHIPFVAVYRGVETRDQYFGDNSDLSLGDALRISASCAAQVSYRKLDDSLEKAETVFGYLNLDSFTGEGEPPHASPVEHQAQALESGDGGNFGRHKGWDQLRK